MLAPLTIPPQRPIRLLVALFFTFIVLTPPESRSAEPGESSSTAAAAGFASVVPAALKPPTSVTSAGEKGKLPPDSTGEKDKTALEKLAAQFGALRSLLTNLALIVLFFLVPFLISWEWKRKTIVIDPIDTPKALTDRGYSGAVIAQRVADQIHKIQLTAKTQGRENSVEIGTSQIDFQVPVANLSLKGIIRYAKQLLGRTERRIKGEIVEDRRNLVIQLRTAGGKTTPTISVKSANDLPKLIRSAAEEVTLIGDPYLIAHFWFFKEQSTRKCEKALEAVKYCLANTDAREHKRAYVVWGNILTVERRFDEAAAKYRQATGLDPKFASAYNSWGNMLRMRRRFDEAIESYRQAIRFDRKYAFAFHNMGNVYADQRKFSKAITCYQRAINLNQRYASAYGNLGNVQKEIGQYELAEKNLRRAIDLDPELVWPRLQFGQMFRRMRRRTEAMECFERVRSIDPNLPNTYGACGDALLDTGDFDKAIAKYRQAIRVDPNYYWAFIGWSQALRRKKHPDEAIEKLAQALRIEPKLGPAFVVWGEALLDRHCYEPAIQRFEEALSCDDWLANAYVGWGQALLRMNRPADTVQKCAEAARKEPAFARAFALWGDALAKMNQLPEALAKFEQAFVVDRYYLWALCGSGYVLRRMSKAQDALQKFEQAHEMDEAAPQPLVGWGQILCDQRRYNDAIVKFDQALQRDGYDQGAFLGRARALRLIGTPEGKEAAKGSCHQLIKLAPWSSDGYRALGEIHLFDDEPEPAIRYFNDALERNEHDIWARLNLGRALYAREDTAGALEQLRSCTERDPYLSEAYREIAKIRLAEKNTNEALNVLQAGARFNSYDAWLYFDWGNALAKTGCSDLALGKLEHAKELAPDEDRIRSAVDATRNKLLQVAN